MNDVKKFFNRRSLGSESSSRFRRRSKPRPSEVSAPNDDPLTSAYSHENQASSAPHRSSGARGPPPTSHSHRSGVVSEQDGPNGVPRGEALPGQAITKDENNDHLDYTPESDNYGYSSQSLPETSGRSRKLPRHKSIYTHPNQGNSASGRFEEDVASRNVKHATGIPPVPPIPQSAISGAPSAEAREQHAKATADPVSRNPIADEVRHNTSEERARRAKRKSKFSSASYYTRQRSPPPTFGQSVANSSHDSDSPIRQQTPYTTPIETPAAGFDPQWMSSQTSPHTAARSRDGPLEQDPMIVGSTAANGTRHAPNYADHTPPAAYDNTRRRDRKPPTRSTHAPLPIRQGQFNHASRSPTASPSSDQHQYGSIRAVSSSSTVPSSTRSVSESTSKPTSPSVESPPPRSEFDGKPMLVSGASEAPSLEGVINTGSTRETIVHSTQEPAVYHDTVRPEVHHIRHEQAQHDIHTHEIQHRVLPVKDVQVLPAKHFAPMGPNGELVEIDESQIPGRTGKNEQWLVDKDGNLSVGQSQNNRSAEKRYVNADGVPTTETTWVHQPRFATGQPGTASGGAPTSANHSRSRTFSGSTIADDAAPRHEHERLGEEAVAAGRARGATADPRRLTEADRSSAKYAAKPRNEQESMASAAVLAARRAADH